MGLLDDAIRDHLELKRRHGANPDEVARIETEALSPAKREAPAPAAEPEGVLDQAELEDDPLADLPYRDAEPDDEFDPEPPRFTEPEPEAVYEIEPEELEELEAPAPPAPERESDPQATVQYSLEELEEQSRRDADIPGQPRLREPAKEPAEGDEDEDVLEETPEFLQETPEHDRLWFEQKPPKDFDF